MIAAVISYSYSIIPFPCIILFLHAVNKVIPAAFIVGNVTLSSFFIIKVQN
jgi:hypothetical protein